MSAPSSPSCSLLAGKHRRDLELTPRRRGARSGWRGVLALSREHRLCIGDGDRPRRAQPSILPGLRREQLPAHLLCMTGPAGHLRHHGHGPVTNGLQDRWEMASCKLILHKEEAQGRKHRRGGSEARTRGSHAFARVSLRGRGCARACACMSAVCVPMPPRCARCACV